MTYSPCKDCKDRKIGCHEDCKEYLDYRAKIDATTENIKNEKNLVMLDYVKQARTRDMRRMRNKR